MQTPLKAIIEDPSPGPSVGEAFEVKPSTSAFLDKEQRAALTKNIDESDEEKLGAWGENQKYIDADSMDLAITRAEAGDATAIKRARQTLDAAIALIDPVWGGVYQYSEAGSWTKASFRKDHVVPGPVSQAIQPGLCAVEGSEISCRTAPRSVDSAAPATPIRGNGPHPKTRTRSETKLKTLPISMAITIGRVMCCDCRYARSDEEQQHRREAGGAHEQELAGDRPQRFRDVEQRQEQRREEQHDRQRDSDAEREPDALPHHVPRADGVAGAERLRDHRIDAEVDADAEDGDGEEDGVAESRRSELARAEAPEDREVDEAHDLRPRLRGGERAGEAEQLAEFGSEWGHGRVKSEG